MIWLVQFAKSSIGAKVVMALTGVILVGFVLFHMLGNWLVFRGPDALNAYAHFLHTNPGILWSGRLAIFVAFILHVISGVRLAKLNRDAQPQRYAVKRWRKASIFSRTMVISGLTVLAFIIYHLLHFTFGVTDAANFGKLDSLGRFDTYAMVIGGFKNVGVSVSYVVAMVLLGMHLSHGVSSMFQSLGWNHPRYQSMLSTIGPAFAALIVVGNISMPLAVLFGFFG